MAVGEGRLTAGAFVERWRRCARQEVKEAAPPQGLCLLRVGYPTRIFSGTAWYAGQPRYQMEERDPPSPAAAGSPSGTGGQPLKYRQESEPEE